MADVRVPPLATTAEITVPAGARVAAFSGGAYVIRQISASANYPDTTAPLKIQAAGQAQFQSSVLSASAASIITIENLDAWAPLWYSIGTDATILSGMQRETVVQVAPTALNATGTLTVQSMLDGIITSTTAAAVDATLPTGAVLDAATTLAINDCFDWFVINTGGNAFSLVASSGHTIVGGNGAAGVIATVTSGQFRTRKTAANTFITYAINRAAS